MVHKVSRSGGRRLTGALSLIVAVLLPAVLGAAPSATPTAISFEHEIRPILMARCYSCHGSEAQEGELRLDQRASAFRADGDGPIVIPGKSAESLLYKRLTSGDRDVRMPKDGKPLSRDQIVLFRNWIDQGANWPTD